jgi:UDP-N-acetylglucosamine--N-acetylmuramyl-(pentapeptide) pyrophosphoryl-undecaprenol N-acetylglucosamine transferase
MGPQDEYGSILLAQEEVKIRVISGGKIRNYFSYKNIIDVLFKIPLGIIQAIFLVAKIEPHLVFSKGGYGALPVVLCAKLLKIPIFIHESDIVPGRSNRISSKWARKIFISFPKTEYFDLSKTILVGNPIRLEILEGTEQQAKNLFDITLEKPVLFFFGGSQGAEFINDFVLNSLNTFLEEFEIIHICGNNNYKQVKSEFQAVIKKELEPYYHLFPFLDEEKLKHIYKVSDFIIARSGSGTIFEIAAAGVPSILVPLPGAAADHQVKNAYSYAQTGAAIVMEQDNLTQNFFLEKIHNLFNRPAELEEMKNQALKFAKPQAAKVIAREILEYLMVQ